MKGDLTVAKLRKILAGIDGKLLVVISRDPEGNNYSVVSDSTDTGQYENEFGGDFVHYPEDLKAGKQVNAFCMWPKW